MRLLVVGAGSTGGYFGGRLAEAGRDVTFLVRKGRAAQLEAKGLEIVSPYGNISFKPKLMAAGESGAPFDAVLLSVKAYSLAAATEDAAPAIGPGTMILPMLNGMKHMDSLDARFGTDAVLGAVCKIAAHLDAEGRIVHHSSFHSLAYGERDGERSPRLQRLDAFMQNASFDAALSPNIEQEMWDKWVMLAALAGITCLMRGSIGEIAAAPGGVDFASRFLDETAAIATAEGHAPDRVFLAATRSLLTQQGSALTASMYRDLQQGARVEADQIIGDLLARGAKFGVPAPLLSLAHTHLSVYQSRLRG
jgi:2-dehydropantoate 2-reductase